MDKSQAKAKKDREEFMETYFKIAKDLLEIPEMADMPETNEWLKKVLDYNVPHGKANRGLSTVMAYKLFAGDKLTEENLKLAHVLGWCVEILQAFFLVSDDIMDGSETRRGVPCWYKNDNLGLAAVNDALMLESCIYQILKKHFQDKSYYAKLMEVMLDITYKTIFGQSLDTRTGQDKKMETYTMKRYSAIVKYKTCYYSFYLPVALAMTMTGMDDPKVLKQVQDLTLEMGHMFQVQDDYLDCFGEVNVTGKIGTDIQDCKCSWLFVTAMDKCTPEQKKELLEIYGIDDDDKIEAVKKIYNDLGISAAFYKYEEHAYKRICEKIEWLRNDLPNDLFYDMVNKIYKRKS